MARHPLRIPLSAFGHSPRSGFSFRHGVEQYLPISARPLLPGAAGRGPPICSTLLSKSPNRGRTPASSDRLGQENPRPWRRRQVFRQTLQQFLPVFRPGLAALLELDDPPPDLPVGRRQDAVDRAGRHPPGLLQQVGNAGHEVAIVRLRPLDDLRLLAAFGHHPSSLSVLAAMPGSGMVSLGFAPLAPMWLLMLSSVARSSLPAGDSSISDCRSRRNNSWRRRP